MRPDRARMASEWDARARAEKARKLEEGRRVLPFMTGNDETIYGRIATFQGELPGMANIDSAEHVTGLEETQEFSRPAFTNTGKSIWED